jgi:glycosyltransferase involved in cell wall biosynthesis
MGSTRLCHSYPIDSDNVAHDSRRQWSPSTLSPVRLGVYTDYSYARADGRLHAEQAFSIFVAGLSDRVDRLVLVGRLNPKPERTRYPIPAGAEFVGLPYYESLAHPMKVLRAIAGSVRRFWRTLGDLDVVWLLGPHPLSIAFALLAMLRGKRVVLGIRQELPVYVRMRHPGRRGLHVAASALEAAYRGLARRCPTVVVGPALRQRYARSRSVLEIVVSLISDDQITPAAAASRSYDGELTMLSVGRVAAEKNPLMLGDVLAALSESEPGRWRLVVCGEGPLGSALAARLKELGVAERAELRGYVPLGDRIREAYASAHFLIHTSWTEGLPQVLLEAFASGLPAVMTDVGGIREAVGSAAILIDPGDAHGAAAALKRLADDSVARSEAVEAGLAYIREHTLEAELDRLVRFLSALPDGGRGVS